MGCECTRSLSQKCFHMSLIFFSFYLSLPLVSLPDGHKNKENIRRRIISKHSSWRCEAVFWTIWQGKLHLGDFPLLLWLAVVCVMWCLRVCVRVHLSKMGCGTWKMKAIGRRGEGGEGYRSANCSAFVCCYHPVSLLSLVLAGLRQRLPGHVWRCFLSWASAGQTLWLRTCILLLSLVLSLIHRTISLL